MRTRHPDIAFWRGVRRVVTGLRRLWLAAVFTALAIGALVGMSFWLMPMLFTSGGDFVGLAMLEPHESRAIATAAVVLLLAGTAVRAVYGHQRFWLVWLLLAGLSALFIGIDMWTGLWGWAIEAVTGQAIRSSFPGPDELGRRYVVLAMCVAVATGGMAVGSILSRGIERSSVKRIGQLRRRIVRRRELNE